MRSIAYQHMHQFLTSFSFMHSSRTLTLLRHRYTYDGNFVDPSTQITGFSAFYPNRVLDKIDKLPQLSNASTGSGLTLQFQTDSSNQARRTFNRCYAASRTPEPNACDAFVARL